MLLLRFSILFSVTILLVLFGVGITHAIELEDAFGKTNYGLKCSNRIYKKYKIYAAVKRLCDAMKMRPAVKYEKSYISNGFRQPWNELYDYKILNLQRPPHFIQPILEDGTLFPSELPPELRVVKNSLGESVKIDPGPDRLLINENCEIIGAFSDYAYTLNEYGGRVESCILLRSHDDVFA